jgi:hypothetical protein
MGRDSLMDASLSRTLALAMLVVGGIIAIAGLAIFWNSWQQTRWQRLEAIVLDSKIVREVTRTTGETGSRQTWTLALHYRYEVAGRAYTSDAYSSTPPRSDAANNLPPTPQMESLLTQYPPGAKVAVFVAPGNPERAVLVPPESAVWKPLAVGVLVMAISAFFWLRR